MLKIFAGLSRNLKSNSARVDSYVFKLHYKATVTFLLAACLLVCSRQFIGDPIRCILDSKIPINVINTYCWISSTYSVPYYWNVEFGKQAPHPGVGPDFNKDVKFHAYYQWVPFVLFLQAILFYFPHWCWKLWDRGKIKCIILGLDSVSLIVKENERKTKVSKLVHYFMRSMHQHEIWSYGFFLCELLNLFNVIGNIYFTDKFLGHQFTYLGLDAIKVLNEDPENRSDPFTRVFPRITKCSFHMFGPSGTVEKHDALCVMATNIINEKIYAFLWFWFMILSVCTIFSLIYSIGILLLPKFRNFLMLKRARLSRKKSIDVISEKCKNGDWLLLYSLGANMDPLIYKEFIEELAESIENMYHSSETLPRGRLPKQKFSNLEMSDFRNPGIEYSK